MNHPVRLLVMVLFAALLVRGGTPTSSHRVQSDTHAANSSSAERSAAGTHSHGEAFELPHIHGLGFTADGTTLLIPAHIGIFTVSDGIWQRPSGPAHDYMGFSISDDGFYSSGHIP